MRNGGVPPPVHRVFFPCVFRLSENWTGINPPIGSSSFRTNWRGASIALTLFCLTCHALGQGSVRTPDLLGFQNFLPSAQQANPNLINAPIEPIGSAPTNATTQQGLSIARFGPFSGTADAAVGYSFNDNANTSGTGGKLSLNQIFENLDLDLNWVLSPFNRIDLRLGGQLQENFYSNRSNALNVVVLPGSEIQLEAKVGDFLLRTYERFAIVQDPITDPAIAGQTNLNRITNTVGEALLWPLPHVDVILGADYTYSNTLGGGPVSTGEGGSLLNSFHFGGKVAIEITPTLSYGSEFNTTYNTGEASHDFFTFSVGPFLQGHITPLLEVACGIGPLISGGPAGRTPDYYAYLSVRHQLSPILQVLAGITHDTEFSTGLGITQNNNVHLTAQANLTRQWTVTVGPYVNFGSVITGFLPGRYTQYGFTVDSAMRLSRRFTANFDYRFAKRSGDEPGGNYTQNLVSISFSYGL